MWSEIDAQLQRADPDRRLAALFAETRPRRRLLALYALNAELEAIPAKVTDPTLRELRFAWWREAIGGLYQPVETPADHPVMRAIRVSYKPAPPRLWMDRLLNARDRDFREDPIKTLAGLREHLERTEYTIARVGAWLCAPELELSALAETALRHGALAWGFLGVAREIGVPRPNPRLPKDLLDEVGLTLGDIESRRHAERAGRVVESLQASARRELDEARKVYRALPAECAPALLYCALVEADAARLRLSARGKPYIPPRPPFEPARRARLVWASATGRI